MSPQPAALTSMSTRPWRAITSAAQRLADFGSARSTATASTARPAAAASLATSAALASLMSAQMTRAPQRANSRTVALPMPEAPPVISAVLSSSFMGAFLSVASLSSSMAGEKCRDACARLGIGRQPPRLCKFVQISAIARLHCCGNALFAGAQRRGRQLRDIAGDLGGMRREFSSGNGPLRDAEPERLGASDNFGAQNEARRHRSTAQSGQALRAAGPGNEPKAGLRQAEPGFERDDTKIASERQFKSAAHGGAADFGQRHLRQPLEPVEKALQHRNNAIGAIRSVRSVETLAHLNQIGAGAEHLLFRTHMQNLAIRSRGQLVKFRVEQRNEFVADGIDRRPAQQERRNAVVMRQRDHARLRSVVSAQARAFINSRATMSFCTSVAPS